MSAIINILVSLGVDKTVFAQLAIFLVAFLFLKLIVFNPFLKAYIERRKRTVGHLGVAKELMANIQSIEAQYAVEAKDQNEKIKLAFAEKKAEGAQEATRIIESGYTEAQKTLMNGKKDIDTAFAQARDEMKTFVPDLGDAMVERLLKS